MSQDDDGIETVHSASAVSTPPHEPFTSNSVRDTVVKLDQAMARLRLSRMQTEMSDRLDVSGLNKQQGSAANGGGGLQENIVISL